MKVTLLACGIAVGLMAQPVTAEIVHFTNPAPGQPGPYDWRLERTDGWQSWLDITMPSAAQSHLASASSVGQMYVFVPGETTPQNRTVGGAAVNRSFVASWGLFATTAYASGDLIGFSDFGFSVFATHAMELEPGSVVTAFPEGQRRYMGVRTGAGNYGWIEVEPEGLAFNALSWAYETEPGVAIVAGQAPAPGSAMLAGVAALARWRARRA